MYLEQHAVALTTAADGSATGYTPVVMGRVLQIRYVKDDFADGVDFAVTSEITGTPIWSQDNVNASTTRAPRQATHATDGTASLFAAAGEPVEDFVYVAAERIKVVVAAGGDTKSGTVYVLVG